MKVCYSNVNSRPRSQRVQGLKPKTELVSLLVVLWCEERAQFGEISIGRGGTKHLWWSTSVQLDSNVKLGPVSLFTQIWHHHYWGLGKTTYHCLYSQASMSKYIWSVQSAIRSNVLATENYQQWKLHWTLFSRIKRNWRRSKTKCIVWGAGIYIIWYKNIHQTLWVDIENGNTSSSGQSIPPHPLCDI